MLDYGQDFYAAQSWNYLPETGKRNIWLGWMSNWDYANDVPTEVWKSAMSIPREVELISEDGVLKLLQQPIKELKELRNEKHRSENLKISKENNKYLKEIETPSEIAAVFNLKEKTVFELVFEFKDEKLILSYNNEKKELIINRKTSASDFHPDFRTEQTEKLKEKEELKQ